MQGVAPAVESISESEAFLNTLLDHSVLAKPL